MKATSDKPYRCGFLGLRPCNAAEYYAGWDPRETADAIIDGSTPLSTPYSESVTATATSLTEDDSLRNEYPMFDGLFAYFPNALAEVSRVSKIGNDQHNPGEPMHWARGKSTDHENKIARHLIDAGKKDARGVRHSARLAWRALALLQEELEREEGAPLSRASRG